MIEKEPTASANGHEQKKRVLLPEVEVIMGNPSEIPPNAALFFLCDPETHPEWYAELCKEADDWLEAKRAKSKRSRP